MGSKDEIINLYLVLVLFLPRIIASFGMFLVLSFWKIANKIFVTA